MLRVIAIIFFIIFISACEGGSSSAPQGSAPSIVSSNTVSIEENIIDNVFKVVALDTDGDDIRYSVISENDGALVSINEINGEISFVINPDYENPLDFDKDNSYKFNVNVTDGSNVTTQAITINITDKSNLVNVCRRTANNLLNSVLINWSKVPESASLIFENNNKKATFNLDNSNQPRLYITRSVFLEKNKKYAFRVKVSDFKGNFDINQLVILGKDEDFIGNRKLKFTQDGLYGMVFQYIGENASFLLRLGIGTGSNDFAAANSTEAIFTIEELMWEELDADDNVPSEYVFSLSRWCLDSIKENTLDVSTGLLTENKGIVLEEVYKTVWAITADSFGNDANDFPQQLLKITNNKYTTFVDSVPGRTLTNALKVFEKLVTIKDYPQGLAKPYGVIIQGGVNDIAGGITFSDLKNTIVELLKISTIHNLKSLILTVPPFKNSRAWNASKEQVRVEYNQWLRGAVDNTSTFLVDIALPQSSGGLAADSNIEVLDILFDVGDGLHPNPLGSKAITEKIQLVLDVF